MPLYEMLCISAHVSKYVSPLLYPLACPLQSVQQHIRELVRQSAMHVMNSGGVVRKINSWGTQTLPQKMKRNGPLQSVGECVDFPSPLLIIYKLFGCTVTGLCILMQVPERYGR